MVSQLRGHSLYNRGISFLISSSSLRNLSTASSLLLNADQTITEPLAKSELEALVLKQYSNGKFYSLVKNAVALPSVLLAASQNLSLAANSHGSSDDFSDRVSRRFSIEEMGRELREGKFDIRSSCVEFIEKGQCDESLVLPNLKLKVLIEAIRMVLEIVYDDRFATFSYGGRVGMGRHTAIRYLKNSVENPRWWFRVSFDRDVFQERNVVILCGLVAEKINDVLLIEMIKKLFEFGILKIELGGCNSGKGFPQECGLCSILINVYFDGLDKEVQDMRLKMKVSNPRVGTGEEEAVGNVLLFYKPVNMYAVRYLDEILVLTSGSKMLTMDLKKRILDILEQRLELRVDRLNTSIHSAVSEKINFLGMYLQAVPPSVLRPPKSEKAVRAMKKYQRQKDVRKLELRNARERNRKTLGLKVFRHVLKKLKQSNGFRFEGEIENEVRDVFQRWGEEVMQEFMGSVEERWKWHWLLARGDFLSLRHIREKLPQDLIDAYDEFQEQVDRHLAPTQAKKALEDEERRVAEEEEQRYAERTVEDLTKLCMKVSAPEELVRKAVKLVGFTNSMGRPRPIIHLTSLEDSDIIKWYAGIGRKWLDFFCCCHNYKMVKIIVSYHMRFSCILTLAEKHGSTKREAIRHYTKDLRVSADLDGSEEAYFPREREVKMMGDKNLSDPKPVDGPLSLLLIRLASDEPLHSCAANFCERSDTIVYRVHLLQNRLRINPLDEEKWVRGMGTIHSALNRKCLPLCSTHISDLYLGKITLQDVDGSSFIDVR
ncbi:PREDICTED: uncharacterized protein LOC104768594 [Camelina sativa]|uniref:Uncharacterized protein LOC104768594 n=1 Tax=Camelina sativa TaxID=90675 RepID=A0ABM0XTP6_CAMSA|nr:PREDICTED: uncharacterized protein LOC104768594 [Camelina sativa]